MARRFLAITTGLARTAVVVAWLHTPAVRAEVVGSCPPWCKAPRLSTRPSPDAPGRWRPGFAMRSLSLRGSVERVRLGDASKTAGSAGIEERSLAYLNKDWLSARYADVFAIGGGNAGIDGGLGMDGALGLRAPFAERHGPFLRFGVRGHFLLRGRFNTSLVEFPQAQVGYSLLARAIHAEAGARIGYSLVGRYAIDGAAPRRLGNAPEYGGYGAIGLYPIRVDVEVSRIASGSGNLTPVDTLSALLCGVVSPPTLCVRAELLRGDVRGPSGATLQASASYVGVSVGIGPAEWR